MSAIPNSTTTPSTEPSRVSGGDSGPLEIAAKENDESKPTSEASSATTATESGTEERVPRRTRVLNSVVEYFKDQWFLVALGILIAISSQVQVPASGQQMKKTVITYLCVSIIFFITGCTLSTRTLLENYSRWKLHLFVQVQCFLMTSAAIFGIVSLCATNPDFMDPGLLVGLIFTGCIATTISSNVVMTRQAHGNQALTVVQSTLGNFLGPFLTPILIKMYTSSGAWYTKVLPQGKENYGELYRRVFQQLGLSIFLPLFVGQVVQSLFPGPTKTIFVKYKLNKIGSFMLLLIIWQTYDQAFATGAFTSVKGSNIVFVVFVSMGLFVIFLGISFVTSMIWLSKEDTIAICYCVPAKTPAMGVPLANVMYVGLSDQLQSKLQIPMVLYQGLQILGGSLLISAFRKWATRKPKADARDVEEQGEAGGGSSGTKEQP